MTNLESIVLRFVLDTLTRPVRSQEVINEVYRIVKLLVSAPRRPRPGVVPSHKAGYQLVLPPGQEQAGPADGAAAGRQGLARV